MAQSEHAQNIAAERHLMEQAGVTRNQARAALREWNNIVEARIAPKPVGEVLRPPTPEIVTESVEQKSERRQFVTGGAGAAQTPQPSPTFTAYVVAEGYLRYGFLNGSLGGFV